MKRVLFPPVPGGKIVGLGIDGDSFSGVLTTIGDMFPVLRTLTADGTRLFVQAATKRMTLFQYRYIQQRGYIGYSLHFHLLSV